MFKQMLFLSLYLMYFAYIFKNEKALFFPCSATMYIFKYTHVRDVGAHLFIFFLLLYCRHCVSAWLGTLNEPDLDHVRR